jgi:hypothetical protein
MMNLTVAGGSVFLAALVVFFVGMLWYSPLLFGNIWTRLSGMPEAKPAKSVMVKSMFLGFLNTLLMTYVLALLLSAIGPLSLQDMMIFGFMSWVTFVAYGELGGMIWEKRPVGLFWINGGYSLVSILVAIKVLTL